MHLSTHVDPIRAVLRRNTPYFVPISASRSRTNRLATPTRADVGVVEVGLTPMLAENFFHGVCTHIRCCGHRVASNGSDSHPIGVANLLWLGDRGILIEDSEGFGSTSGEYEGSSQMQERKHTWGRHGARIKNILHRVKGTRRRMEHQYYIIIFVC